MIEGTLIIDEESRQLLFKPRSGSVMVIELASLLEIRWGSSWMIGEYLPAYERDGEVVAHLLANKQSHDVCGLYTGMRARAASQEEQ